jgi:hypothetical protein
VASNPAPVKHWIIPGTPDSPESPDTDQPPLPVRTVGDAQTEPHHTHEVECTSLGWHSEDNVVFRRAPDQNVTRGIHKKKRKRRLNEKCPNAVKIEW